MAVKPVLSFTEKGIYCPAGDFYIDPWRPVPRALVTHGHLDHARPGHGAYLATHAALPVIRHRLGAITADGIGYAEPRQIGAAQVSFHPAGHVPGSAQIRVAVGGEVWVVSGDYKLATDGLSEPFESVKCHTFITECTFGLPVFHWPTQAQTAADMAAWWGRNAANGRVSVMGAYGLGKAQRIMAMLADHGLQGPIYTHGAVEPITQILRAQGYSLPPTTKVAGPVPTNALVIAPPSALGSAWAAKLGPHAEAFASGWMALRGVRRRRNLGTRFVISDHADWDGLNSAIRATGATRIFATHGYTTQFRRWLEAQGYDAGIVATEWQGEAAEGEPEANPE
ncbi:ligase-associated DNA damage response exonuclease [Pseudorhodobacter ferrugineus]|uniref:ligase-associated DNA damage response exonuclease n=1 Tax=Pseudorhodobacter ferrugineus TaxID=77008 RepID=UPI0003B358C8|nr:ligase-associated DNA damage response exonuclease [Pseudorhodobacter ferrugineus]